MNRTTMMRISGILMILAICTIPFSAECADEAEVEVSGIGEDLFFIFKDDKSIGEDKVAPIGDTLSFILNYDPPEESVSEPYKVSLVYAFYAVRLNNLDYEIKFSKRSYEILESAAEAAAEKGEVIPEKEAEKFHQLKPPGASEYTKDELSEHLVTIGSGTVMIIGAGLDTYHLYDAADTELAKTETNKYLNMFDGTYTVRLNKTVKTVTVPGDGVHGAGAFLVKGKSEDGYSLRDTGGNELGGKKLNEMMEVFPGTYTLLLNGSSTSAYIAPYGKREFDAGSVKVTGQESEKDFFTLYDANRNEMKTAKINEPIEVFGGTYTAILHMVEETAIVEDGKDKTIAAGWLTVTGNKNSKYQVFVGSSTEGDPVGTDDTGTTMNLFPEAYTVQLNGINKTVEIKVGVESPIGTGTLSVKGTGQDPFLVYSGEKQLMAANTNTAMDLFPQTYRVLLNGTQREVSIRAGETAPLTAGSLLVTGTGDTAYYVSDAAGKPLISAQTGQAKELFPGTYTVKLNNVGLSASVQAGEETPLVSGLLNVSGTGAGQFSVYDDAGNQLAQLDTGAAAEFFEGTYTARLNGVERQNITVAQDKTTELKSATLTVIGSGTDTWNLYDGAENRLASAPTNEKIDLFSGTYTVELNNTSRTVTLAAGEDVQGRSARLTPKNSETRGVDLTEALHALRVCAGLAPEHQPAADLDLNRIIDMKDAILALQIVADLRPTRTVLVAGAVKVDGEGINRYYVLDRNGNSLVIPYTGTEKELFGGNYTVRLNNIIQDAAITPGKTTAFETGRLVVLGDGTDFYSVWGQEVLGYFATGQTVEFFPGTYSVEYNWKTKPAAVEAGMLQEVTFP